MSIVSVCKRSLSLPTNIVLLNYDVPKRCENDVKKLLRTESSLIILNPTAHFTTKLSKLSKM